jgi:hypothetical protein
MGMKSWLPLLLGLCFVGCRTTAAPEPDHEEAATPAAELATPVSCEDMLRSSLLTVRTGPKAVLDWSGVTTDGEGNPLAPADIDELRLMFYELDRETCVARNCGGGGLTTQDIAYVVQEGELKGPTSTPFDTTPFEGKTATIELLSQGKVRKYVFAKMDATAPSTTFTIQD